MTNINVYFIPNFVVKDIIKCYFTKIQLFDIRFARVFNFYDLRFIRIK